MRILAGKIYLVVLVDEKCAISHAEHFLDGAHYCAGDLFERFRKVFTL
jgi:hypothetical protein